MGDDETAYKFTLSGLRTPPRLQDVDDAEAFLKSIIAGEVISNATYLGVTLPKRHGHYVLTTYSKEWSHHYFEHHYFDVDPAISVGMSGLMPFDWHSIPKHDRRSDHFFNEAREFGLARNGLSIPIRGAVGDRALLSFNSPLLDQDWENFKARHLGQLTIFAYLFHLRVLELEGISQFSQGRFLRPREQEVLQWAARGKSSWETARILGLSEATVNFYIRNAAVRLSASNKTQAVAVALSSHLI
jgi:DNA-binding CsgD family transcriptional regulator